MPRRPTPETLETFLNAQDAPTLAALLLELADAHEPVHKRLVRLQLTERPDKLAAEFKKTLNGWRRATRFIESREVRQWAAEMWTWIGQTESELLPRDPPAALALAEAFIESDGKFFERADDSNGDLGGAVGAAARLWLIAASRCETPAADWQARIAKLADGDSYGARGGLLSRAGLVLDEPAMRQMATSYLAQIRSMVAAPNDVGRMPIDVFGLSGNLALLAQALGDPDVHVQAVLSYSPQPNPNQKEVFVRDYLAVDRPADALRWMEDDHWGHLEDTRKRQLAETLRRLDRTTESATLLGSLFEKTLLPSDLHAWLEHLPTASQHEAMDRARRLAFEVEDPVTAARLLLDIGDAAGAEAALLAKPKGIDGGNYAWLVPLAKALDDQQCPAGATVLYRALLDSILDRAFAGAYRHAARYWVRLGELGGQLESSWPSTSHADYAAGVRQRHARKTSFWEKVKAAESRRGIANDAD